MSDDLGDSTAESGGATVASFVMPDELNAEALLKAAPLTSTSKEVINMPPMHIVGTVPPAKPHANVNWGLPDKGDGYSSKSASIKQGRHFGVEELVKGIAEVGKQWHVKHPKGPRFFVGDMSKRGGGPIAPHKSHQKGVDADIAALRNDGKEGYRTTKVGAGTYSNALTSELILLFEAVFGKQLTRIWFADSKTGGTTVDSRSGTGKAHTWHFHIRIDPKIAKPAKAATP
jgi:hypothetical protein